MRLSICFTFLATSSLCTALAIPAWSTLLHKLHSRQANSTTSAAGSTYTVAAGDTLNSIAAAAGVPEQSLEAANPGVVATDLQVGEVLDVPTSSTNTTDSNSTDVLAAMYSNVEDASSSAGSSAPHIHPANGTSGCGGGHHHHNGTSGAHNGTGTAGVHAHNSTDHARNGTEHQHHNGTLLSGQGDCNASDQHQHHHNGTSATGTTATGNTTAAHHHGHNGTASAGPVGTGIAIAAPYGPDVDGTTHAGNGTHHHHHHHHNGTSETGTPAAGTFSILSTAAATALSAALTTTASV